MAKLQYPENKLFLTTIDNPFNPATEPEYWAQFDSDKGYNSYALVARFLNTSPELSESEQLQAQNDAVLDAVDSDLTGTFIAVHESTKIRS